MLSSPHEIEALVALRREQWEMEVAQMQYINALAPEQRLAWWRRRLGGLIRELGAMLVLLGERLAVDEANVV